MKKVLVLSLLCSILVACGENTSPDVEDVVISTTSPQVTVKTTIEATPSVIATELSWHVPVLMYHHIGNVPAGADKVRQGLTVSTSTFKKHLAIIKQKNYQPITFADINKYIEQGISLPEKPIIITLDDGYDDNYLNAFPALEANDVRAVFYIITDKVGQGGYMSWEQIRTMKNQGQEIGAHTRTHPDLAVISGNAKRLADEIIQAKQILEDKQLGPILSLAYPSGKYNAVVATLAGEHYLFSRTTHPGIFTHTSKKNEVPDLRIEESTEVEKLLP